MNSTKLLASKCPHRNQYKQNKNKQYMMSVDAVKDDFPFLISKNVNEVTWCEVTRFE